MKVIPILTAAPQTAAELELGRQMQICNACRYCEGFCAVFPAMTRRLDFSAADLHQLANLCHSCGACLHACQYAPPHEFAVNVPRATAALRQETYQRFAWPAAAGAAYARNGFWLACALAFGLALFLVLGVLAQGSWRALWAVPAGGFYGVFPHGMMVSLFLPVFAFALLALGMGVLRFWREQLKGGAGTGSTDATAGTGGTGGTVGTGALAEAAHDALTLRYLDGGHGEGCHNEDDAWTHARRRFHHLTFYGFALCFAATSVATVYHYVFGWMAPYGWTSLPKLLGMLGGLGLVAGTAGLWWLRRRRHPQHLEPTQRVMDEGFIALLFLTGASGLSLALAKGTPALPLLLCLHLGSVLAFFITMPYSKFAHGAFRAAALLRWAVEKRQPLALKLGSE